MKREIKFRAYDKKRKEMFYNYPDSVLMGELDKFARAFNEKNTEVMQFTGLKDKNGKGIYEGDIVNAIAEEDYQEETRTSDVIFAKDFQWQIRYRKCYEHGLPVNWGGWASLEVVGNIYENPNLLEETK